MTTQKNKKESMAIVLSSIQMEEDMEKEAEEVRA
jgi:hypothetical protein